MKFFESLFKNLGMLIGGIVALAVYLWGFFKLCVYTFSHWWIQQNGTWSCGPTSRNIARHTLYCNPIWISHKIHWGVILLVVGWIILSIVIGCIIAEAVDDLKRSELKK